MSTGLKLDWCSVATACYAVEHWHYSHSLPAGKIVTIGVWEHMRFVGCVIFGRGSNRHIGSPYSLEITAVCELMRVALRDHQTPVSKILSIGVRMLRKQSPGLRLIVSYADAEIHQHHGGIYQAANWVYVGKADAGGGGKIILNEKVIHSRTVGTQYGRRDFQWLRENVDPHVRRFETATGKHKYLLPLDDRMRQQITHLSQPYPKRGQSRENAAVPPSTEGGVIPTCPLQFWTDAELEESGTLVFAPVDVSQQGRLDQILPRELSDDGSSLFEDEPVLDAGSTAKPAIPSPVSALAFALGQAAPAGQDAGPEGRLEALGPEPAQPDELAGLLASLAARGVRLLTRDGKLFASESSRLTDDDRATIKRHKAALLAVAAPWAGEASTHAAPSLFVAKRPGQSLAQFLGDVHSFSREDPSWRPDEPPDLSGVDEIVLNFETNGLRWWDGDMPIGVTVSTLDGRLSRFLPFGFAGGNLDRDVVVRWLQREVRGKRITNANMRFDVHMGRNIGVDFEEQGCTVSDVQHYAALLDDNRKKFNIDLLAEEMLGGVRVPRVDESRMASHHASEVAARARYQVQLVAELRAAMWPRLDAEDLQRVRQLEDDVIYPVCEMERNGAPIDVKLLERWVKESGARYDACLLALARETGRSINPDSPGDLEKLFNHLGLTVARLESGAPSFTDAILKRIDHPLVQQVRFATKLSDLRSRYLLKYQKAVGADGILRYALHQTRYQRDDGGEGGTGPGRFSSSELDAGVGCNIQQVLKVSKQRKMFGYDERDATHDDEIYLIRRMVVPREGTWLCADAMQIEYRGFAHYANNPRVVQAYRDDPRLNFHALIEGYIKPHRPTMNYDDAKTLNFATIYGAAQVKQATMLGFITEEEAAEIRARKAWNDPRLAPMKAIGAIYDRELPEVRPLIKRASELAQARGFVKTLMGRRSRFDVDKRYHKALNNVLQGGAADYNKVKLIEVHRARKHTGLLLRFTVHDELNGDARMPETLERVREVLNHQSWPELRVPLLWDVRTGPTWADCK